MRARRIRSPSRSTSSASASSAVMSTGCTQTSQCTPAHGTRRRATWPLRADPTFCRAMSVGESATLRAAVLHMERFRNAIDAEVNRRMGRAEPPPEVRNEIVRRFRSFCRLASLSPDAARPSLDGLHGNDSIALEQSVSHAVRVAIECGPEAPVVEALRLAEQLFNAAIRRILQP